MRKRALAHKIAVLALRNPFSCHEVFAETGLLVPHLPRRNNLISVCNDAASSQRPDDSRKQHGYSYKKCPSNSEHSAT